MSNEQKYKEGEINMNVHLFFQIVRNNKTELDITYWRRSNESMIRTYDISRAEQIAIKLFRTIIYIYPIRGKTKR